VADRGDSLVWVRMTGVTETHIDNAERPPIMACTEVLEDGASCNEPAEWVALSGPSYAMTAASRCLNHALAARRAGCHIRPISQQELAAGKLDS
jgi:hypothetical protein